MSHWKRRLAPAVGATALLLLAGCGGSDDGSGAGTEAVAATDAAVSEAAAETSADAPATEAPVTEAAASAGAAKAIALPAGWTMEEAVTAEEVSAITGETMAYFPDAASQASQGRPSAGYNVPAKDFSVVFLRAVVGGGEAEYESTKDFAVAGSIVDVPGVGDKAYLCDFTTGASVIVVLQGQDVLRADWRPDSYPSHDKVELGTKLITKLIEKLYK